jgi:hypothetical protein
VSLDPANAPRPLPGVPCPIFEARTVRWEPWSKAPAVTHIDPACDACAFPGPLRVSSGTMLPNDGEMFETRDLVRSKRRPDLERYGRARQVRAWPVLKLFASLCPQCFAIHIIEPDGRPDGVRSLLCDGCDAYCAAGSTWAEARANLARLGGWSSGEADWDLCPACNPNAPVRPKLTVLR